MFSREYLGYLRRFVKQDGLLELVHYLRTKPKYFEKFPIFIGEKYPHPFEDIALQEDMEISKWLHYFPIYKLYLNKFFDTNSSNSVKMIEIGVARGGSLRFWEKVFGPDAIIFGIDIDSRCNDLKFSSAKVRIGSQTDSFFLDKVVAEMGGLDMVIDDGSHINRDVIKTFETLFPKLALGGVYIIEDVATSYWPGVFRGGFRRTGTSVQYFKNLVDLVNSPFFAPREEFKESLSGVASIHFHESVIVIKKEGRIEPSIWKNTS